jgi:hypothetical protein
MFKAIKEFFLGKPEPVAAPQEPAAPYKVEAPTFKPTADAALVVKKPVSKAKKPATARKTAARKPAAKKPTPTP